MPAETARALPANAIGFVKNSTALPPAAFTASRKPVDAAAKKPVDAAAKIPTRNSGLFPQNRQLIGIYVNFDGFTGSPFAAHIALGPDKAITEGELVID